MTSTRGLHDDPFSHIRQVIGAEEGRPIYLFSTDSPLRSMSGNFEALHHDLTEMLTSHERNIESLSCG